MRVGVTVTGKILDKIILSQLLHLFDKTSFDFPMKKVFFSFSQ